MRHPISSALCRRWPLLVIWNMNEFSWASFTCANSFSSWLYYSFIVFVHTVSSSRKHRHSEWMELASWASFTRADSFGPWLNITASSSKKQNEWSFRLADSPLAFYSCIQYLIRLFESASYTDSSSKKQNEWSFTSAESLDPWLNITASSTWFQFKETEWMEFQTCR